MCVRHARKLSKKVCSSLFNSHGKVFVVIRKVQEWRGRAIFLPLKKHRCVGPQKQQRSHGSITSRRGELVQPRAARGICKLVEILDAGHKRRSWEIECTCAAALALPQRILSLIKKSPFNCRDEFLRIAAIIGTVRLIVAREADAHRLRVVIVPQRIEAITAGLLRSHQSSVLRFIFSNQNDRSLTGGTPRLTAYC